MLFNRSWSFLSAALFASSAYVANVAAQQVYTAHDYAQAERWMSYNTASLVGNVPGRVSYLPDGRVFFSAGNAAKYQYKIADPKTGAVADAFDQEKLAAALSTGAKRKVNPDRIDITQYTSEANGFSIETAAGKYHCDAAVTKCTREPDPPPPVIVPVKPGLQPSSKSPAVATATSSTPPAAPQATRRRRGPENASPDKKLAAFIRDNNLWVREVATGQERQLTTDGAEDYGYATDNAGWEHSGAAIVTWSADGKKIATFQQDQRKTGMMYLVPVTNRHPELEAWRYPLVGDKDVTMIEPVVIDVATATAVRLKTPPLQHRSMECDDVSCADGKWTDVEFSPDDNRLAFVSTSRDHKDEYVKVADTSSGEIRDVYHEHVDTYYGWQAKTDWKVLWSSNEFLWVSERSNYAQLYLYDLNTGKLKNEVTHGDGPVYELPYVDEQTRIAYFTATGKQPGVDPYFEQLYSVSLDGKNQTLLTPEAAEHEITAAPDGSSFVDIYSTAQTPKIAVLRDKTGKVLATLAKEDISALVAAGWHPAVSIKVKARDGKTDLYGFLVRPSNFDPAKKYPVIDYVYPGPQDGSCGGPEARSFQVQHGDNQAMADLGFIYMCLDGMGNPHRSKAFHDAHASRPEDMGDDTIPDQVSGIKDLASQHAWIDLNRVGIWGHSGGGNATASAMFHFPDFFKVGWSESGNHDNRDYEDDWDERWAGLEVIAKDGKSNYDAQANQNYAKNLKGHLMLVHGTMDDNVPPSNTLLVDDALMKANKNFDMLMVTNAHHGYAAATPYITRRRWDYFVQYLAGGVPPADYQMTTYEQMMRQLSGGPAADESSVETQP